MKGQLPPGVSITTDNVLQGTPTQAGLYSFTLRLTINPRGGVPPFSKDTDYTLEIKAQGGPRGHVTVNRSTLHLARSSSNTPTSAQPIFVNIAGPGVIGWTISSNSYTVLASSDVGPTTLISLTSVAGTVGNGIAYIMANPYAPPSTSPSTAIVTIQDTGGSAQQIAVTVTNSTGALPFGVFDTPVDNSLVSGPVPVTGWALDDVEVQAVDIYRDPVPGEPGQIYIGSAPLFRTRGRMLPGPFRTSRSPTAAAGGCWF